MRMKKLMIVLNRQKCIMGELIQAQLAFKWHECSKNCSKKDK